MSCKRIYVFHAQVRRVENRGIILLSLAYDDDYNSLNGKIVRLGKLPKSDVLSASAGKSIHGH